MLSLRRHDPCPPALPRADFQNVQIAMMPVRERPHAVQDILALAGTVTDVPSRFSIQMLPVFVTGHLFLGDSQIVSRGFRLAAPQGFEPRYADPESAVLPLNEGAVYRTKQPARTADVLTPFYDGPSMRSIWLWKSAPHLV